MPVHNELEVCRVVDYESYAKPITAFTPVAIFTVTTIFHGNSHLAKCFKKNTTAKPLCVSGLPVCVHDSCPLFGDRQYVNRHKYTIASVERGVLF